MYKLDWLKNSVLYQIYVRSFADSDNDGIGDLNGVTGKLDYLQELGVGAIWLTPFYKSPMVDLGYDVADHCAVDPMFGTMADFKRLLREAHNRGLKVLIDLVPNHTSDQHAWFKDSKSSKKSDKRDWYVWRDGKPDGSPPNNWQSVFGGPAWQFDKTSGQYYLHSFLKEQPDLNWENPAVREAIKDVMRFWLTLGVDGFRVDAIDFPSKDPALRDDPKNAPNFEAVNSKFGPKQFDYISEMADVLKEYPERFMVTETYLDQFDDPMDFYENYFAKVDPALAAPLNFDLIFSEWSASRFAYLINTYCRLSEDGVQVYCLGNHDNSRLVTRYGKERARAAAVLQLSLPGMPVIYYGEELGMKDSQTNDLNSNHPSSDLARYAARTPMQWDRSDNAGFSKATPWQPVNWRYRTLNVETERLEPDSFLNLYKHLIALRRASPALRLGSYSPLNTGNGQVFGFERTHGREKLAVLINFSDKLQTIERKYGNRLVLSSTGRKHFGDKLTLQPNEAVILR